jgi:hypothetical protein
MTSRWLILWLLYRQMVKKANGYLQEKPLKRLPACARRDPPR